MSTAYLISMLVIAIAIVVVLIVALKMNAAIALVIGSLFLGLATGLPLVGTDDTQGVVDVINSGFGNMMTSMGFAIGFGIMLGQFVSDCGGANVIADALVRAFPEKYALYAVAFAGFILSIPVFFDVTFVILIPIGVALINKIHKHMGYIVGAISIGAGVAHTLVPPTPNPLVAPEYFHFDLGIMILAGILFGVPMVLISVKIHSKLMDKGLWKPEKDETGEGVNIQEQELPENLPNVFESLLPILCPIICILLNTIWDAANGDASVPAIVGFLGTRTISMMLGTLVGMAICIRHIGLKKTEGVAGRALLSAGVVFLITGAGGSFSAVITASGVSDAIKNAVSGVTGSPVVIMLIAWALGLAFREITGSGTVASLSTFAIMQNVAFSIHPVFLALACLDGALFGATINDSGFWIVSNMSGFNFTGGVKTYTLGEMIASIVGIILLVIVGAIATLFV